MTANPRILAAARRSRLAAATMSRLLAEQERGHTLRPNQQDDYDESVRTWNEARSDIPGLPTMSTDLTDADVLRAVRALDKIEVAESVRHVAEGMADGGPSGDFIRGLIDSGERQFDVDIVRGFNETRAISDFANSGSLYTSDFATQVAVLSKTISPWLRLATVVNATNGRPLVVPTLTADVVPATPGEGTAISPSDPTLGSANVSLTSYKALTLFSAESLEDVEYDLTAVVARNHARAIGLAFGTAFTTTVLASINNGGTALAVGGYGTATGTFAGYEDLVDLSMSRQAPYRASGVFVMSNGMIKKAMKWKDQQGEYFWEPATSPGQPPTILGYPVYEDPGLASPASATKSTVFGDLAAALIIKSSQLRVEISREYLFNTDQIAVKTVSRLGGAVQDATAAAFLVSANA